MKRIVAMGAACLLCTGALFAFTANAAVNGLRSRAHPVGAWRSSAPKPDEADQAVLQADHALLAAIAKDDVDALSKLLDGYFEWTDSEGNTFTKTHVLLDLPKPAPGYDNAADTQERTYGDVGVVQDASGKVHVLRIWVKRPEGWRALVYTEVTQAEKPPLPPETPPKLHSCENPCKITDPL